MELFPLHCEHSGCTGRFHALMEKEKHKTETEFYSLNGNTTRWSCEKQKLRNSAQWKRSLRVRFHQATQFNSSAFMNFECTPSQPKQSLYFKFMGIQYETSLRAREMILTTCNIKPTLKIHLHVIITCIITYLIGILFTSFTKLLSVHKLLNVLFKKTLTIRYQ